MKKIIFLLAAFFNLQGLLSQDLIEVHYMDRAPFFYHDEQGNLTGIEHDILTVFKHWLEITHHKIILLEFKSHKEFNALLTHVESGTKNIIGVGTVTYNEKRSSQYKFAGPYLKNSSLLVSYPGKLPASSDFFQNTEVLVYVTKESVHESRMNSYQLENTQLQLATVLSQTEIPFILKVKMQLLLKNAALSSKPDAI